MAAMFSRPPRVNTDFPCSAKRRGHAGQIWDYLACTFIQITAR